MAIAENTIRIQIFSSKTSFCLIGIIGHEIPLSRSFLNLRRFFHRPLLDKSPIRHFFKRIERVDTTSENFLRQLDKISIINIEVKVEIILSKNQAVHLETWRTSRLLNPERITFKSL